MAIEDGIVLADEIARQSNLNQALNGFMSRRFERCRLVIENSVQLAAIEMAHGSMSEHTRLMTEALGAFRQPI